MGMFLKREIIGSAGWKSKCRSFDSVAAATSLRMTGFSEVQDGRS
jgi:hypothetical protein